MYGTGRSRSRSISRHLYVHDDFQQVPYSKLPRIGDCEHLGTRRQDRVLLGTPTGDGTVPGNDRHARGGDLGDPLGVWGTCLLDRAGRQRPSCGVPRPVVSGERDVGAGSDEHVGQPEGVSVDVSAGEAESGPSGIKASAMSAVASPPRSTRSRNVTARQCSSS
jgi:hypothetical protein